MKNYLKILLITLAIQLIGVFGESLLYNLESSPGTLRWVRNIIFLGCVLVAIIVDIILAIRWGRNIKEKMIYIFLMPTNYLWIVVLLVLFWHVAQWLDILGNIYR